MESQLLEAPAPTSESLRRAVGLEDLPYLVVADGAGEYDHDFTVCFVKAQTPSDAARIALHPRHGYGRNGKRMFVIHVDDVAVFELAELPQSGWTAIRTGLSEPGEYLVDQDAA